MCRFLILKSLLIESFKVVSLFNYQGSVCFSLLLYSLAQLLYPITLPSLCQQLFKKFFMYPAAVLTATFIWYHSVNHLSTLFFEFYQLFSSFDQVTASGCIRVAFCFLLSVWDNFVIIPPRILSVNSYFVFYLNFLHN